MQDCKKTDILTVTTTVASMADAQQLARQMIEARLAACVQLDLIAASIYRWQGDVCSEPEVRLTLKTTADRQGPLEALMARLHPYALPQFVAWHTACSSAYADWVRDSVAPVEPVQPEPGL